MSEERATYMGETPEDNTYQIRDEAPHDHFSQIPNLVDDLNLTPFAYRLYGHLRRVAGESGKCWQSTKTLAKSCNMSMGSVSEAKKELENTYPPLIRVSSKTKENGIYHEITITDIWALNHDYYTGASVHIVKTPPKRSHCENPPSHGETKKNSVKEEPSTGVPPTFSIDWQIGTGQETVIMQDDIHARMVDAANLISTGTGSKSLAIYALVMAFQTSRQIVFTESDIKAQRKAARVLLEKNVKPTDITNAVKSLLDEGMTITDLFSVTKTAISLANPAPDAGGYNPQGLEVGA